MKYLIGIGNWSMGDDGIGLRVVEAVEREGLAKEFEAVDIADDGMRLLFYCTPETERIVLVDAVELGLAPGVWRVFRPEAVETRKELTGKTSAGIIGRSRFRRGRKTMAIPRSRPGI